MWVSLLSSWADTSTSDLLHDDDEVHASVNRAVDMKDACTVVGADFQRATFAINVVQNWGAWLCCGKNRASGCPGAVLQEMLDSGIVDDQQFGPFGNKHHVLHKIDNTHVDGRLATGCGAGSTCLRVHSQDQGDQTHPDDQA